LLRETIVSKLTGYANQGLVSEPLVVPLVPSPPSSPSAAGPSPSSPAASRFRCGIQTMSKTAL
jgi:hypothetical protein